MLRRTDSEMMMLDHVTRPLIDPLLNKMAATLHRNKVRANQVTLVAFIAGLLAMILIALGQPLLGLALFALNRILDVLDGVTLADIIKPERELAKLLGLKRA